MICPHCNYVEDPDSEFGEFYRLFGIELKRDSDDMLRLEDTADVYGCPRCKKLFMVT